MVSCLVAIVVGAALGIITVRRLNSTNAVFFGSVAAVILLPTIMAVAEYPSLMPAMFFVGSYGSSVYAGEFFLKDPPLPSM
jgi:cytochrome bd-type quinol oxidase subunit 2